MDEVVLRREFMMLMKQVIRQFNEAIETRLKFLLETPKAVGPKPSESMIFSMGSNLPKALISTTATNVPPAIAATKALHSDRIESPGLDKIWQRPSEQQLLPLYRSDMRNRTGSTTNTDAETVSTQNQPDSLGVSQSIDTRNDDQISVITLPSQLRDPVHDTLVSHSVTANVDENLRADNSNAVWIPTGQTFLLRCGRKNKLRIRRGYSVHVILPKIHFEFIYESNEATSKDSAFAILTSEWLISLDLNPDAVHMNLEDLTVHQEVFLFKHDREEWSGFPCSGPNGFDASKLNNLNTRWKTAR